MDPSAESEHEGELSRAATATNKPKEPSRTRSPEPPASATGSVHEAATASRSSRKSGRPARRGGRGRNQYTRERDMNTSGTETNNSPRGAGRYSHDVVGADSPRPHRNGAHVNGGESGKPSRPRYMNPQRTTMNEMKRRVAAILEFISRMQVEMAAAGESSSTPTSNGNGNGNGATLSKDVSARLENNSATQQSTDSDALIDNVIGQIPKEKDFRDLSSVEMMDVLTRHLLKWQREYGKFGER